MYSIIKNENKIKKQNSFIKKAIFVENSIVWMKKEFIINNKLIVFPTIEKVGTNFLKFHQIFKNINSKYYISGIDISIKQGNKLDLFFLPPQYLYEVDSNFYLDILEPPHYYLINNFDFTLGYIYDSDTGGDYTIFAKEKYWKAIFGNNFIEFIIKRLENYIFLYQNKINKEAIKNYINQKKYYESILKEQGYLK